MQRTMCQAGHCLPSLHVLDSALAQMHLGQRIQGLYQKLCCLMGFVISLFDIRCIPLHDMLRIVQAISFALWVLSWWPINRLRHWSLPRHRISICMPMAHTGKETHRPVLRISLHLCKENSPSDYCNSCFTHSSNGIIWRHCYLDIFRSCCLARLKPFLFSTRGAASALTNTLRCIPDAQRNLHSKANSLNITTWINKSLPA